MSLHVRSFALGLIVAGLLIVASGRASAYTNARHIIYTTFPHATAPAALRVVRCETGGSFSHWAFNPSSRATGLFQVLQGNAGRILHYHGRSLRIVGRRLWGGYYNARVALFLSHGGRDWSEWSCGWAA